MMRTRMASAAGVAALLCTAAGVQAQGSLGACCLPDGSCTMTQEGLCLGEFHSGRFCNQVDCDAIVEEGACCLPHDTCILASIDVCAAAGGEFFEGEACENVDCSTADVHCAYEVVKARARRGCTECSLSPGDVFCFERCEDPTQCAEEFKERIACGDAGFCKIKARRVDCRACD